MAARKNPERHSAQKLKQRYGMTLTDYNRMLEQQKGKCLICDQYRKLVVDHCHGKGHVRGLLCNDCNSGIGSLKDSVENLQRAIRYLNERGKK